MTENHNDNLIGFYASFNMDDKESNKEIVKSFLWGKNGLKEKLKTIKWNSYGQDFQLILFQFYVNPISQLRDNLKEIESYRRKEKAIGIPVVIDKKNFFKLNESKKWEFLNNTIIDKLDLLVEKVKRNKLDLNVGLLKTDVENLLKNS